MEKCKFCLAEIEEGLDKCPCCGKDLKETAEQPEAEKTAETAETAEEMEAAEVEASPEEAAAEEVTEEAPAPKKATPLKIALAVTAIVLLLAILAGIIFAGMQVKSQTETTAELAVVETIPADGEPGTITEKGTYSVTAEEALTKKDEIVAMVGDKGLTNSQLQVYYWMSYQNFLSANYSFIQYMGLDFTKPLDVQIVDPFIHGQSYSMTWQQFFVKLALDSWHQVQAMSLAAQEAGMEMDAQDKQDLENLEATLAESIASLGVSVDEYLQKNFGPSVTIEDYKRYQQVYYEGAPYYNAQTQQMIPTDAELEAYFDEHQEEYASGGVTRDTRLVDVRHILLQPETAEDGTISDESWTACEKAAQELLDIYLAGEKTEEGFAALANEHSTDPGSNTNGGLYSGVYEGQMVPQFNDWCFDTSRQTGDTGLVRTDYGYHIMYFVDSQDDVWKEYATSDWVSEKASAMVKSVVDAHPMTVTYANIALAPLPEE